MGLNFWMWLLPGVHHPHVAVGVLGDVGGRLELPVGAALRAPLPEVRGSGDTDRADRDIEVLHAMIAAIHHVDVAARVRDPARLRELAIARAGSAELEGG